jgi:signal transduction histidine kinase
MERRKKERTPYTILIVDDDPDNLHLLSLCLKETGNRILVALDGESSVEKAILTKPDLILMDVVMPGMNGFDACLKLNEHTELYKTPVIFMTSLTDSESRIKGFEVGGVDYINKPFYFKEVLARVNVHLQLIGQKKELQNQKDELEQWAEEEVSMNEELNAMNEELTSINVELTATNEIVFNENLERIKVEKELAETNRVLSATINELKETQTFLIQSEKMAALGNLVAGLAHEINTPIGIGVTASSNLKEIIRSFYESFLGNSITKEEFYDYMNDIHESADIIHKNLDKAGQLIRNFKLVSTDQSNSGLRKIGLKNYLEEILLTLRPKIRAGKHIIRIDCDDELELKIHAGSIAQIFTNLILNSIIHGFANKQEGEIDISTKVVDNYLKINYRDNGSGMDYETQNQIFDPFFTTKRGQGGTGLGMYIVHNTVSQQLKGSITCFSEPDIGTRFEISLPLNQC